MRFEHATAEAIELFYGGPPPRTFQGYVVLDGDDPKPKAVGGFIRHSNNVRYVFVDSNHDARRKNKVTTLKFAKMLMAIADLNGWTLLATPEDDIEEAVKTLEHLGFEYNEEQDLYVR